MASKCISSCVDDARVPVRATYVNLYKWPESDFEFVRSMSSKTRGKDDRTINSRNANSMVYGQPRVVDSILCRQMYLRSYTFSREEDYKEDKTVIKCLGRKNNRKRDRKSGGGSGDIKCSFLASILRRLLSCTTKVDVAN